MTPRPPHSPRSRRHARAQRGAATLVVVMVLFFVLAIVAAYTSRDLLFEQRIAINQQRAAQATEAAEAGLQWALGLLNAGRIDERCLPATDAAAPSFRQRHLQLGSAADDNAAAAINPRPGSDGQPLQPGCVFSSGAWACGCPARGIAALAAPDDGQLHPAFRVRFVPAEGRLVRLEARGCSHARSGCLAFAGGDAGGDDVEHEGRASASVLLALKGALASEPVAALTARGTITLDGAALQVLNTQAAAGLTLQAGGAVSHSGVDLAGPPGSPPQASVRADDGSLQFAAFPATERADAMFVATFGMARHTYRDQPGTVRLDCATPCGAAALQALVAANPQRIVWVDGTLAIDQPLTLGSAEEPLALVATGAVTFGAAATVHGLIYSQAPRWTLAGNGTLVGAAVAEGDVDGTPAGTLVHDAALLRRLRHSVGSLVAVPGSWRDF